MHDFALSNIKHHPPFLRPDAVVGATPYTFFLKVPWVNKQLASSDFTFRRR
jgi:hypothetical protein